MKQHRRFLLNQLTGFMMMGVVFVFMFRPMSAVIDGPSMLIFCVWFFTFGWILAYNQHVGHLSFFILTLPILGLSSMYATYVFLHTGTSALPAYLMTCYNVTLQYCHARQEEWRKWMNP